MLPRCSLLANERSTFFSTLRNLDSNPFKNSDFLQTNILLFGKDGLNTNQNTLVFMESWDLFYELRDLMSHFLLH